MLRLRLDPAQDSLKSPIYNILGRQAVFRLSAFGKWYKETVLSLDSSIPSFMKSSASAPIFKQRFSQWNYLSFTTLACYPNQQASSY